MKWVFPFTLLCLLLGFNPANAMVFDPPALPSLGCLNESRTVTINTDTLQLKGSHSFTGVLDPITDKALFVFDGIQTQAITDQGTQSLAPRLRWLHWHTPADRNLLPA